MSLDSFKSFVRNRPYLINYVKSNKMTWQQFYEIYDLYGENDKIWDDFENNIPSNTTTDPSIINTIKSITNLIKGIDLKSIQKALTSLDKAIEAFKGFNNTQSDHEVYEERPSNKYFED